MNKFIFIGRIVKDPEISYVAPEDKFVAKLTIAQNIGKKKENGKRDSIFFSCQIWNQDIVNMLKSGESVKGLLVSCIARVIPKSWKEKELDENGKEKWHNITNYFIDEIDFNYKDNK